MHCTSGSYVVGIALVLGMLSPDLSLAKSGSADTESEIQMMPEAAAPGAVVVILGDGFGQFANAQESRVLFNGVPALVQRWEPTLIEARVPITAKDGAVEVQKGKQRIVAGQFRVQRPVIERVEPAETEPGAMLSIHGQHFGPTAGPRDPNSMFGVNDVVVGGVVVRARRWHDNKIEVQVPPNAKSGSVQIRLGSSDPLPDGSCCAKLQRLTSNTVDVTLLPTVRLDPVSGPVGTKVVVFGSGFGSQQGTNASLSFNGHPAMIATWNDTTVVAHVPLDAESGPVVLRHGDTERTVGKFDVKVPKVTAMTPMSAPIGTLVKITGENFGLFSESGSAAFAFTDFNIGDNGVEFGGVPGIVYRWHDNRIDAWVPFSAKSGPVIVTRGASRPKPDGTCCAEKKVLSFPAGEFAVVTPQVASYEPHSAGLDEIVTIKGSGFGDFIKMRETVKIGMSEHAYKRKAQDIDENISRTEVLFNGIAVQVVSWKDDEIKIRVPRRHLWGMGKGQEFQPDLSKGQIVVRRGSWDPLPDGTCCHPQQYISIPVGEFTIEARGLPNQDWYTDNRPDADTNQ